MSNIDKNDNKNTKKFAPRNIVPGLVENLFEQALKISVSALAIAGKVNFLFGNLFEVQIQEQVEEKTETGEVTAVTTITVSSKSNPGLSFSFNVSIPLKKAGS